MGPKSLGFSIYSVCIVPVDKMGSRCVVGVGAALPPVVSGSQERTASPEAARPQASDPKPVLLGNFPN